MQISDDDAKRAHLALGDLAEALAISVEAMTRIAIALKPGSGAPSIHIADPLVAQTLIRTACAIKD